LLCSVQTNLPDPLLMLELSTNQNGMSKKKSFVLRVQQDVYDSLERWAADEFRSVNGQIEYLLQQALKSAGRIQVKKTDPVEDRK